MKKFSPKPKWIQTRVPTGPTFNRIRSLLQTHHLHTVCSSARCPNQAECWEKGTATLLLLGSRCTRNCRFCSIDSGSPDPLDPSEPDQAAETIRVLNLQYVVLTSVTRDDLKDGGSFHWALTIQRIQNKCPKVSIEVLVPDFQGNEEDLKRVLETHPQVFGHNLETVERLTPLIRDSKANYRQSLKVLENSKKVFPQIFTKSSLLLGMGETTKERMKTLKDLRSVGVDFIALGQYLQPTRSHLKVDEFLSPLEFRSLKDRALKMGFRSVASGPMVRSSYHAFEHYSQTIPTV